MKKNKQMKKLIRTIRMMDRFAHYKYYPIRLVCFYHSYFNYDEDMVKRIIHTTKRKEVIYLCNILSDEIERAYKFGYISFYYEYWSMKKSISIWKKTASHPLFFLYKYFQG